MTLALMGLFVLDNVILKINLYNEMMLRSSINGVVCLFHCQHPEPGWLDEWGSFCVLEPNFKSCQTGFCSRRKMVTGKMLVKEVNKIGCEPVNSHCVTAFQVKSWLNKTA